jgi:pimeloyl-ACP methyl ester carboxylesterase
MFEMTQINQSQPASREGLGFVIHGKGPEPVLVMHDWNGDHTSYDPTLPYLDTDQFTYVFVDLRGYGKSRAMAGNYTVGEISRDCLDVADKLGWRRFHVIGHSMTGMVTQRMAVDAQGRIKSAVAVCPISAAGSQAPDEALTFFANTTEDDDAFCRLIKFVSGGLSDRWAVSKLRQNRLTVDPACRAGYLKMFSKTNFVADVRGNTTPFLVVVAENDPGLDEAAVRETFLAWHPNAEVTVIPNCGHYPMQECPPYFATIVERFLRGHAS